MIASKAETHDTPNFPKEEQENGNECWLQTEKKVFCLVNKITLEWNVWKPGNNFYVGALVSKQRPFFDYFFDYLSLIRKESKNEWLEYQIVIWRGLASYFVSNIKAEKCCSMVYGGIW